MSHVSVLVFCAGLWLLNSSFPFSLDSLVLCSNLKNEQQSSHFSLRSPLPHVFLSLFQNKQKTNNKRFEKKEKRKEGRKDTELLKKE